jgi:hypothetical protein
MAMIRPPSRSVRPAYWMRKNRALGVRRHEAVVSFLGHLVDKAGELATSGRVDDHDVQAVEPLFGLGRQPAQVRQAALIGLHRQRPAARGGHLADHPAGCLSIGEIAEHHRGAVRGQPLHDRPAYPP